METYQTRSQTTSYHYRQIAYRRYLGSDANLPEVLILLILGYCEPVWKIALPIKRKQILDVHREYKRLARSKNQQVMNVQFQQLQFGVLAYMDFEA
jgi:hypothetical protein